MRRLFLATVIFSTSISNVVQAQPPESFFPHHIGDRWDYQDLNTGQVYSMILTRDSIGPDGSRNLFYNNVLNPRYRIDTAHNVFLVPRFNYLRYKLGADSCQAWEDTSFGSIRWAWVARVDSAIVFSRRTVAKVFKYAPGNPCSLGSLEEDWLAAGFGLIYTWREPNDITYLRGCIIAGDTFGTLVSVPPAGSELAGDYELSQNYPNPFNPSTTIEFDLPEASTISIRVYNLVGQQVAIITEGKFGAGAHRVLWDARGLPTGVYFGRMQTQGNVRTIKMLLVR